MKIAMIGSGAAGSVFASYLRRGGADITLVDPYKEHMDAVAANGMDFTVAPDQHYHVEGFKTAYNADDIGIMDIVIYMTKATFIEAGIKTSLPCIGDKTVLVSLMNGVGNEDFLIDVVGEDRVIFGSGVLGTLLTKPGACVSSPGNEPHQMNFGPAKMNDLTKAAGQHLEKCFNDGGCPCKFWDDVSIPLWTKATTNCVYNTLCAISRLKSKYISTDEHGYALVHGMVTEIFAVAKAKGVEMDVEGYCQACVASASTPISNYYPSMAQDMLLHERQTEIETLNGRIIALGKKFGIPTPYNEFVYHMVSLQQAHYDVWFPKDPA